MWYGNSKCEHNIFFRTFWFIHWAIVTRWYISAKYRNLDIELILCVVYFYVVHLCLPMCFVAWWMAKCRPWMKCTFRTELHEKSNNTYARIMSIELWIHTPFSLYSMKWHSSRSTRFFFHLLSHFSGMVRNLVIMAANVWRLTFSISSIHSAWRRAGTIKVNFENTTTSNGETREQKINLLPKFSRSSTLRAPQIVHIR